MKTALVASIAICVIVILWAAVNIVLKWKGEPLDSGMAVGTSICVIGLTIVLMTVLVHQYNFKKSLKEIDKITADLRAMRFNLTDDKKK